MMALQGKIQEFLKTQTGNVAVVVETLDGDRAVAINTERVFPSASTIKLAIMSELFNRAAVGDFSLTDTITITEKHRTGGDGILKELNPGHIFTLEELCTLMIILSDNEATNILIDFLGMENINATIKRLGLKDAHLGRHMMDSEARRQGHDNFISAEDLAKILKLIVSGRNVNQKSSEKMLDIMKRQQVRGRLDLYLPGEIVIAHKTGDLDLLEHDVGIVYPENGKAYIIVVLTNETTTNKDGREIIGHISKMAYDYYTA